MATEDFTTYTEVDSGGDITITSSRITYDTMRRDANSAVYKDYGIGHFGDMVFYYTIFMSGAYVNTVAPWATFVSLTNTAAETRQDQLTNNVGFSSAQNLANDGTQQIYLWQYVTDSSDFFNATDDTIYYLTLERTATTITLKIYSDSGRTTLLDTLSVTHTSTTLRYITAVASRDNATGAAEVASGYVENLDLNETKGIMTTRTGYWGDL